MAERALTSSRSATRTTSPSAAVRAPAPRLLVNTPGDRYERDADRIADAVTWGETGVARPDFSLGTLPIVHRKRAGKTEAADDDRKRTQDEDQLDAAKKVTAGADRNQEEPQPKRKRPDEPLMRKPVTPTAGHMLRGASEWTTDNTAAAAGWAPPSVDEALASPGRPLDSATRAAMESRFGVDLSHARIHTDARAGVSARDVDALAYTVGRDIVFASGAYSPSTLSGRRLLAHELAHVLQQCGAGEAAAGSAVRVLRRKEARAATPDPLSPALNGDNDAVRALTSSSQWPNITLTATQAARLIVHLLDGATMDPEEQAGLAILRKVLAAKLLDDTLDELDTERRFAQLLDDYHGSEYRDLLNLLSNGIERLDVKGYYLDLFTEMWWVREFEEEAIVDLLARTSADDVSDLLIENDRAADLRDAIDTDRLSRRFEEILALAGIKHGENLKTQLTNIFTVDAAAAVASGKRTQEEVDTLLERATLDLTNELVLYRLKLEDAIRANEKPGEIAAINREFDQRLATLLQDKSAEFGLELKYNLEFNRRLGVFQDVIIWTEELLENFDKIIIGLLPYDMLHANPEFKRIERRKKDPHVAGSAEKGQINLYGLATVQTVAHELGHQIHFSDEKMFKAFQKLSGWEQLTPADLRRLIPDQIERDRLRVHLDRDHDRAAGDEGFYGKAHEFGGLIYRFARYSPRGTYWRHRKDATFISPYAATVPDDDFAESFAYYILEPERLQKECPSKYAFMHVDVFTEYRITRQREGLKAKFDALNAELVVPSNGFRNKIDSDWVPLLKELMGKEIDAQRTRAVDVAKASVTAKPKQVSQTAVADVWAKPFLDRLRRLWALAGRLSSQFVEWHAARVSFKSRLTPQEASDFDRMSFRMSEELTKDLLKPFALVGQRIMKGELVPMSEAPDGRTIVNQYINGFPVMRTRLKAFVAATKAEVEYKAFRNAIVEKFPVGSTERAEIEALAASDLPLLRQEMEALIADMVRHIKADKPLQSSKLTDPTKRLHQYQDRLIKFWVKRRKPTAVNPSTASTEAPIAPNAGELAQDAVSHPGQALEADTRATLEPAFGFDLSSVRVHTDESAAASAGALNARAFTIGEHVVFGAAEFAPHSAEGQTLLAHELTHVAQQQGGGGALAMGGSATVQSPPNVDFDTVTLPTTETSGADGDQPGSNAATQTPAPAARPLESGAASTTSEAPASPDATRIAAAMRPGLDARTVVVPRDHPSEREAERVSDAFRRSALVRPALAARSVGAGAIARAPAPAKASRPPGVDLVFIMGKDRTKRNPFYSEAVKYFRAQVPGATLINDEAHRSLETVFAYLRQHPDRVANLYLVSHANEDGTLSFPIGSTDKDRKTSYGELNKALTDSPERFGLPKGVIDAETVIRIKGCNIGRSTRMLDALDRAFGGAAKVVAPTHKQVYGTEYTGKGRSRTTTHYEALDVYFIEYTGNRAVPRASQLAEFQTKYTHLDAAWWARTIPKRGARRDVVQTTYSYDYTTNVKNKNTKAEAEDEARAKAIEWGETDLARPDMYEWRVLRTSPSKAGWKVVVAGEKTNYVIDRIVADAAGKRLQPAEGDVTFFGASTFGDAQPGAAAAAVKDDTAALVTELMTTRESLRNMAPGSERERAAGRIAEIETALKGRHAKVDVLVNKTEDWLGADEVYVRVVGPNADLKTATRKLNDGERHLFQIPLLLAMLPLDRPVTVEVYDEDLGVFFDRDDLIARMLWQPPFADLPNLESLDGADYRVMARL